VVVELLGRKTHILDLSREISPDIPIYSGHAKVAFWWNLTHDEAKHFRIHPESRFGGYAVKGMALCDHVSTHIDAVYRFNRDRPDLTVERIGLQTLVTPAAWIDPSGVPPRTHITLAHVQRALVGARVILRPGMTLLCYTGANIQRIPRHTDFYVMILPLRFQGLTGSPVRALALWTDDA
jgi:kynurenine formamidase